MAEAHATLFDVPRLKEAFPILHEGVLGRPLHYLDNAATSQTPDCVISAVSAHERTRRANVKRSVHFLAEAATEAFEEARHALAAYINAPDPHEVIFTSGATHGINLVAHSLGRLMAPGDEVVISRLEHHSNIVPWQFLRDRGGIVLKALPLDKEGAIDLSALDEIVTTRTRLIAVTHASNVTGSVTPVGPAVEAARRVGAHVLLDGAQIAPHGPLDVAALGADFYAFSSHKMFGPNGVGVLWGRRELLEKMPPFHGGGEMIHRVTIEETSFAKPPHRFEAGTPPIAQAVGMGEAARWCAGLDWAAADAHLRRLTGRILEGLEALSRPRAPIRIIGPRGTEARLPIVSFDIEGAHPHDVCQILDVHGVALRGGHHCAQPLMDHFGLAGTTRASLAPYNDDRDIDAFLTGLEDAIRILVLR